jgi:hypothetical protein
MPPLGTTYLPLLFIIGARIGYRQLRALSAGHGVLDVDDNSQAALARAIWSYL